MESDGRRDTRAIHSLDLVLFVVFLVLHVSHPRIPLLLKFLFFSNTFLPDIGF